MSDNQPESTTAQKAGGTGGAKRHRSPAYPAIDLKSAIERAATLYEKEKRFPMTLAVAASHWEMAPKSSGVRTYISALIKYGLLEDGGGGKDRKIKISDSGFKILIDKRPDSTERRALIREAAMKPKIYREIWDHFEGSLPSDANLEHYLLADKSFNESSVGGFISDLRKTFSFAGIEPGEVEFEAVGEAGAEDDPEVYAPPTSGQPPANPARQEKPRMTKHGTIQADMPFMQEPTPIFFPKGIGRAKYEKLKKKLETFLLLYEEEIVGEEDKDDAVD